MIGNHFYFYKTLPLVTIYKKGGLKAEENINVIIKVFSLWGRRSEDILYVQQLIPQSGP